MTLTTKEYELRIKGLEEKVEMLRIALGRAIVEAYPLSTSGLPFVLDRKQWKANIEEWQGVLEETKG